MFKKKVVIRHCDEHKTSWSAEWMSACPACRHNGLLNLWAYRRAKIEAGCVSEEVLKLWTKEDREFRMYVEGLRLEV